MVRARIFSLAAVFFVSLLFCGLFCSCDGGRCEGFNFQRLPFDSTYYRQRLAYTNGFDTLTLFAEVVDRSRESRLNPIGNPDCNPVYAIEYSAKMGKALTFLYSFSYYPEDSTTRLYLSANSSHILLDIDSIQKKRIHKNELFIFDKPIQAHKIDSTRAVKKIVLQSMRAIEVEKFSGEKWRLIKVGK